MTNNLGIIGDYRIGDYKLKISSKLKTISLI